MSLKSKIKEIGQPMLLACGVPVAGVLLSVLLGFVSSAFWIQTLILLVTGGSSASLYIKKNKEITASYWRTYDKLYKRLPISAIEDIFDVAYERMGDETWEYKLNFCDCDDFAERLASTAKMVARELYPDIGEIAFPFRIFPYYIDADPSKGHQVVEVITDEGRIFFSPYSHEGRVSLSKSDIRSGWQTDILPEQLK